MVSDREYLISAIICTYNRADILKSAIDSLAEQSLDRKQFEIIVVDNNSTDHTPAVVRDAIRRYPQVAIRHIVESVQGLSTARNRGFREAKSAWVAYLDDDATARADYLAIAVDLIQEEGQSLACLGGPVFPKFDPAPPAWFDPTKETLTLSENEGDIRQHSLWGPNMIWRRSVLDALGGFPQDREMRGNIMGLGEETAVFERLRDAEANGKLTETRVFYSPRLVVDHLFGPDKTGLWYVLRRAIVSGRAGTLSLAASRPWPLRIVRVLLFPVALLYMMGRGCNRQLSERQPWSRCFVSALVGACLECGVSLAHLGASPKFRQR